MAETQKISWRRLTAEGAAIVISILQAFWIDAWWEDRVESAQLAEYLAAVEAELVETELFVGRQLENTSGQLFAAKRVLLVLADGEGDLESEAFIHDRGRSLWFCARMRGGTTSI